jgi:hypothetical protein
MAKGQKRSNKEVRKPKAVKQPAAEPAASPFAKGARAPISSPKKKK